MSEAKDVLTTINPNSVMGREMIALGEARLYVAEEVRLLQTELASALEAQQKAERKLAHANGCWRLNHEALGIAIRERDEARAAVQRLTEQHSALNVAYELACKSLASSLARAEFAEAEAARLKGEVK